MDIFFVVSLKSRSNSVDPPYMSAGVPSSSGGSEKSDVVAALGSPLGLRSPGIWVRSRVLFALIAMLAFMSSLVGATWLIRAANRDLVVASSLLLLVAVIGLLFGVGFAAREFWYWRVQVNRLARSVGNIRAGLMPMAELDAVGGGARVLVEPIRAVLFDLREQKRIHAELEEEMRHRVYSRTDALERRLSVMQQQASRDALSGLGNRRSFDALLPMMFEQAIGSGTDLCVLMIDVDNFKPLNDTLGHAAGDEMLRNIGQVIKSSMRDTDAAFRVGGDEFVVLLSGADEEAGRRLADRISKLVAGLAMPLKMERPVGLSIGVASLREGLKHGERPTHSLLVAAADARLYEVKKTRPGRAHRGAA